MKAAYNIEPYLQAIDHSHIFSSLQLIDKWMKAIFSGGLTVAHIQRALKVLSTKTSRYLLMKKSLTVITVDPRLVFGATDLQSLAVYLESLVSNKDQLHKPSLNIK